ncbi:cyclic AMP-dependent transcription factor ATF-6 alpha [Callorhinchus milii]|uniref:BZIP domain-containing protein n=2 Tax=Callorhinchus milii TaxID=7868 RepID=A0A4W3H2V8_CALMI|nr:cyclic AMP-dependent transcription factor ATF-6 alpha [Callorhinchus milii]|eukprot:gi/632969568/ref/XP_007901155.1/ PREDICTED: cyclic AMP-dependent transcription factor ATF-6 alpha [Callorhinchus milii]
MALSLEPGGLAAAAAAVRWSREDEDWESLLFEELIGSDDDRQALKSSLYDVDMDNIELNLDFMPWDFDTWNQTSSLCPDEQLMSEPSSPASLGCLVPSPSLDPTLTSHEEVSLSPTTFQASPASLYSESSDYSVPVPQLKVENVPQLKQKERMSAGIPSNGPKQRPVHMSKPIQPKPILIPTISVSQSTKTILLQPVQTVVPGPKPPIRIYPAPTGQQVVLPQLPVVQLQPRGILNSQPAINIIGGPKHVSPVPAGVRTAANSEMNGSVAVTNLVIPTSAHTGVANGKGDANALKRQERMIKNRESACVSRRRKKEYLVKLENRLRSALAENVKLKDENGLLQKQLQQLISENDQLKVTTPKRRVVCVMALLAFMVISYGPANIWDQDFSSLKSTGSTSSHSRHLLGFSEENEAASFQETAEKSIEENNYRNGISFSDKKDLMVVRKEPLLFVQRACQPQVNGTESLRLADELRGWVHRHEVVRVKSRKGSRMYHKTQTGSKFPQKKTDVAQYVPMQYPDTDKTTAGNELQVYYAPDRRFSEFFETIRRRGDTFYLISFRRDHLLLPAISHNKTSKPKMSLVLPAMNIDESFISEPRDHEVMMQIDCEVTATRIIHIKTSTIPSFLRDHQQNHTDSDQHSDPTPTPITPPIITESVQGTGFKLSQQ